MELVDSLPGFSCRRCARCCTGKLIVLYERDLGRLKGITKNFSERTTPEEEALTGAKRKMLMAHGRCVLLENGLCSAYEQRPDTCRRHPFIAGNSLLVASTCCGIDWSTTQDDGPYRILSEGISKEIDAYLKRRSTPGDRK
jgi:Fe-S-cluster containining protein